MSCCRKSKRPKREEPLELVVSLEEQRGSLLEESATPAELKRRRRRLVRSPIGRQMLLVEFKAKTIKDKIPLRKQVRENRNSRGAVNVCDDEGLSRVAEFPQNKNDRHGKENKGGFLMEAVEEMIRELEQIKLACLAMENSKLFDMRLIMGELKRLLNECREGFQENLLKMINDEEEITPEDLVDDLASDPLQWCLAIQDWTINKPEDVAECILRKHKENILKKKEKKKNEEDFLKTISDKEITPKALANYESSSLLMAMKVSFELRRLADQKTADEEKFNQLTNSVDAFTYCLLDPLRNDKQLCETFGDYVLNYVIEDAIDLDQKKFFTHPAVEDEMNRKFRGHYPDNNQWIWWQLVLFRFFCLWCAFDWVIFPILYAVISLLEKRRKREKERRSKPSEIIEEENEDINEEASEEGMSHVTGASPKYRNCSIQDIWVVCFLVADLYSSPYGKCVRDTLSYIVLVVLHYTLCLSPSTIAFSRIEWVILIFFVGRYLTERQQIRYAMQRIKQQRYQSKRIRLKTLSVYLSDPWNLLDFISLLVYLIIITLRIATVLTSGSEMNNRALAIAGYFYSFNTLVLTLRVFGFLTEQLRNLGVIQIALINILKDISTIILQFIAGILAFSIAITKVFMAEKSFIANGNAQNDITCRNSGLSCWWAMVTYLGWSLLGAQESDPMMSVDVASETVAKILYAAFLIFGVILLLNMLIALLCNTWQRTEDNSLKVWTIKRAITIQTYDAYDPVPVPLNIVYNIGKLLRLVGSDKKEDKFGVTVGRWVIERLEDLYFAEHKDNFPVTDEDKFELVLHEERTTRERNQEKLEQVDRLVSDVLCTTFSSQGGDQGELCVGPEMWKVRHGIQIEGPLLSYESDIYGKPYGAKYRKPFSSEFPHFEFIDVDIRHELIHLDRMNAGRMNNL
ncbi:hypothetical protein ACROYT_G040159 [Oculina patagonica]